jgi:hypothetical protein
VATPTPDIPRGTPTPVATPTPVVTPVVRPPGPIPTASPIYPLVGTYTGSTLTTVGGYIGTITMTINSDGSGEFDVHYPLVGSPSVGLSSINSVDFSWTASFGFFYGETLEVGGSYSPITSITNDINGVISYDDLYGFSDAELNNSGIGPCSLILNVTAVSVNELDGSYVSRVANGAQSCPIYGMIVSFKVIRTN